MTRHVTTPPSQKRTPGAQRVHRFRKRKPAEELKYENAITMCRRYIKNESRPCFHLGEKLLGGENRKFVCEYHGYSIYCRTDRGADQRRGEYLAIPCRKVFDVDEEMEETDDETVDDIEDC